MVNAPSDAASITFLGKDPEEHCQFYFRQHWIRLWWKAMHLVAWTIFVLVAGWMSMGPLSRENAEMQHITLLVLSGVWIISHTMFLAALYRYFVYVVVITDRRIHRIKRTLLTHDDHQTIDLQSLQDVHKFQRGPVQSILGFGSLHLEAQDTKLRIHFVPRIAEKYERILRLKEIERVRNAARGLEPALKRGAALRRETVK